MKKIFLTYTIGIALAGLSISRANAQQTLKIGTNPTTVTNSAVLDVEATNKGALLPRVALTGTTDVTTILSPVNALTVFNTATAGTSPNNVLPGYYYWNAASNKWVKLTTSDDPLAAWSTAGNAGLGIFNFLGTTDSQPLRFKLNNLNSGLISPVNSNVSFGYLALGNNAAPDDLTAQIDNPRTNGLPAVQRNKSVAIGYRALANMNDPRQLVAIGAFAMGAATATPLLSTAIGYRSMYNITSSTTGNTAVGWNTLSNSINGNGNVAIGSGTLSEVSNDGSGTNVNGNVAVGNIGLPTGFTRFQNNIILGNSMLVDATNAIPNFNIAENSLVIGNSMFNYSTPSLNNRLMIGMRTNEAINVPTHILIDGDFANKIVSINNTLKVADLASTATVTTGNRPVVADANGQLMIGNAGAAGWTLTGNAGTDPTVNFLGTTDAQPLAFRFNNSQAGYLNGVSTALGSGALAGVKSRYNTAIGNQALPSLTVNTAVYNTAIGGQALYSDQTGSHNVAVGYQASWSLLDGRENTAIGTYALQSNVNGSRNVAIGHGAGFNELGSNKLIIANNTTGTPLVYGDFAASTLDLNASVKVSNSMNIGSTSTAANSTLQVNGSVSANIVTVSSNYTATNTDYFIIINCAPNSNIQITLPAAASCKGRLYRIRANTTVDGDFSGQGNIVTPVIVNGNTPVANQVIPVGPNTKDFVSDGTNWIYL